MSAVLRVRDDKGNIINIPAIKGDKGDDGFSPTVAVTDTDTGREVAITDKNGVHRFPAGFTILTATAMTRTSSSTNNTEMAFRYSDYTGGADVLPHLLVVTTSIADSNTNGICYSVAINCKALALGKTHTIPIAYSNSTLVASVEVTFDGAGGMTAVARTNDRVSVTATLYI